MLDFYRFIFHYINERASNLLYTAIQAFQNQQVTAESDGTGGE